MPFALGMVVTVTCPTRTSGNCETPFAVTAAVDCTVPAGVVTVWVTCGCVDADELVDVTPVGAAAD